MTKVQYKLLSGKWVNVITFPYVLDQTQKSDLLRALRPGHRIVH